MKKILLFFICVLLMSPCMKANAMEESEDYTKITKSYFMDSTSHWNFEPYTGSYPLVGEHMYRYFHGGQNIDKNGKATEVIIDFDYHIFSTTNKEGIENFTNTYKVGNTYSSIEEFTKAEDVDNYSTPLKKKKGEVFNPDEFVIYETLAYLTEITSIEQIPITDIKLFDSKGNEVNTYCDNCMLIVARHAVYDGKVNGEYLQLIDESQNLHTTFNGITLWNNLCIFVTVSSK